MQISYFLTPFVASFLCCLAIILTKNQHITYSGDFSQNISRKIHTAAVPRVGGISIYFGLILGVLHFDQSIWAKEIILYSTPIFLVGLMEDITKTVSVRIRLIAAMISGSFAFFLTDVRITSLGLPLIDPAIEFMPISAFITIFAITGLINSYNIIDGNNGLASMLAIITFTGIGIIAYKYSDDLILFLCILMASSLFGFFLINFPRGLIFLGDGGAYLIGFILSITTISLIQRHESISPFAGLLINALPVTETIFSIYRRKFIRGKNPSHADQLHLHSLVYRRLLTSKKRFIITVDANPKTSIYIWIFACFSIIPSVLFPENSLILIFTLIIFISLFLHLYWRLINKRE